MNLNNIIYIFSFFNGIRNRKITEGKQFFLKNYSGFSWHLRERRYLLMTRRGPVEYVFNLKHYLVCLSVFLFGLCSSLSILTSFIINVVKEDLVSTARATPIIVADFIDYRALVIKNKTNKLNANLDKTYITFKNSNYAENIKHNFTNRGISSKNISSFNPINDLSLKVFNPNDKVNDKNSSSKIKFYTASIDPNVSLYSLEKTHFDFKEIIPNNENQKIVSGSYKNFLNITNLKTWLNPDEKVVIDSNLIVKDIINAQDFEKYSEAVKPKTNIAGVVNSSQFSIRPQQMPLEAEAYRILSGFDEEILQFKSLLEVLSINIGENLLQKVDAVLKKRDIVSPNSMEFFKQLTDRVSLTKDLRLALNYIPLKAPMDYYYVSSKYGYRKDPITKKKRFHPGIDLAGTWHEDVQAPADGTVIFAGKNGGYGNLVKIRHKYGIVTAYGHLQKVLVRQGQKVTIGKIIGKMGSTGRSTGQHLHYEIYIDKKHVDPGFFIKEGKKLLTRNILQASSR
jgi:murein DD-endopeptidase MepM/ murein hydrolase activator NlpD